MTEENVTNTETPMEQSPTSQEQAVYEHEKQAFTKHVETSNEGIPENFKDAGSWFDSLKGAQKEFTQAKQENAKLREQMQQPVAETPAEAPVQDQLTDQLRIPTPEERPEPPKEQAKPVGITDDDYENWSMEFAATGNFSDQTQQEIKNKTGFTDRMLKDYTEAQQAKLREGYGKAASKVGGMDNLNKIFKWASETMATEELQAVNMGLSSSNYEVTLRGLAAMYDNSVSSRKSQEPAKNENLTQISASQQGIVPYGTQREFKQERNDPRFEYEPKFRDAVQARMAKTDWNTLPF